MCRRGQTLPTGRLDHLGAAAHAQHRRCTPCLCSDVLLTFSCISAPVVWCVPDDAGTLQGPGAHCFDFVWTRQHCGRIEPTSLYQG